MTCETMEKTGNNAARELAAAKGKIVCPHLHLESREIPARRLICSDCGADQTNDWIPQELRKDKDEAINDAAMIIFGQQIEAGRGTRNAIREIVALCKREYSEP